VEELFQALVGAVLPDDDYYDNATLNGSASHAGHAITRVFSTQGEQTKAGALRIPWRLTLRLQARASRRAALQAVVRWHTRPKSDATSDWSRPEPDIRLREEMGDDIG
jgi:hypothetical protein